MQAQALLTLTCSLKASEYPGEQGYYSVYDPVHQLPHETDEPAQDMPPQIVGEQRQQFP
jgi:hypothetical protein